MTDADKIAAGLPPFPWLPMASAPTDGTVVRLLVKFDEHATEDVNPGAAAPTIGSYMATSHEGQVWQFAGWCWSHDHWTEGKGEPIGWLPLLTESDVCQDDPEFGDGHDHEGFKGGCERHGHTPETCPSKHKDLEAGPNDASVAAIQFALEADEGMAYLRLWNEGEFDKCRKEWPEAPESCYIGADPLHPMTKVANAEADQTAPLAILRCEIGESSWFDHAPVRPGSAEHKALESQSEWDYCPVFATNQPVAGPIAGYAHTKHMERGQTQTVLSVSSDPFEVFGEPGKDYSAEYDVTTQALVAADREIDDSRELAANAGKIPDSAATPAKVGDDRAAFDAFAHEPKNHQTIFQYPMAGAHNAWVAGIEYERQRARLESSDADVSPYEQWVRERHAAGRAARAAGQRKAGAPNTEDEGRRFWLAGWVSQDDAFRQEKLETARVTGKHVLYETADGDGPEAICDSNGEVVLDLCRNCGRTEVQLLDNPKCDFRLLDKKKHHEPD